MWISIPSAFAILLSVMAPLTTANNIILYPDDGVTTLGGSCMHIGDSCDYHISAINTDVHCTIGGQDLGGLENVHIRNSASYLEKCGTLPNGMVVQCDPPATCA